MSTSPYSRFQAGHTLRGLLAVGALIILGVGLTQDEVPWVALNAPLVVLFVVGLLFHGLQVDVDDQGLRVSFGIGVIRKQIPFDDIRSVSAVRTTWLHGWGIRLVRSQGRLGWLWNVSGLDAVELNLVGDRVFQIGTDDPQGLAQAVRERLTTRHT